jgi:5S rRNA maturation endonuclease (ribonuclease M5)
MSSLDEWVEDINESGKVILVEGINDIRALRRIGVKNDIVSLSRMAIFEVVEELSGMEVVILTDFDKKGKELYGKLNSGLQNVGVKVDHKFREWLQRNTKISCIEGLR